MAIANQTAVSGATRGMSREEKKVIFASSLGTVFEWYDFYLYGSLAAFIGTAFFSQYPEATRNIFALLAFAAGFLVRPFGALVFGRLGDVIGRKYTFLVTILIMGLSTFLVGLLPGSATIGILAPIALIGLRMLQGLALGGEYGGAATYVAEHAPPGRRGYYTSWIQTTATMGLFLSLLIILGIQTWLGKDAFAAWGWRIPFLVSVVLLGISVWIRLQMNESPIFQKMKEEGKTSKAPLSEAFGQWKNAKIAILALLGAVAGQAVVWYTGQFYALFFLQNVLKVDAQSTNLMVAASLLLGTGFFVVFGWLSDKIGRKPIILAGLALAVLTYFPLFKALTEAANPALAKAQQTVATVTADPKDCNFQFNPTGTAKFTTSCDIATAFLTRNSVPYEVAPGAAGSAASVKLGEATIESYDSIKAGDKADAMKGAFEKGINLAMQAAGYPLVRDAAKVAAPKLAAFAEKNPELNLDVAAIEAGEKTMVPAAAALKDKLLTEDEAKAITGDVTVYSVPNAGAFKMVAKADEVSWSKIIAILTILVIYVTMVYGPIAAWLVEMFPTRIRYSGMSLPYHIGNGWFGGLLPATSFAMSAATGDIYYGLWYPIIVAAGTFVIGLLFVRDDKRNVDLHAMD